MDGRFSSSNALVGNSGSFAMDGVGDRPDPDVVRDIGVEVLVSGGTVKDCAGSEARNSLMDLATILNLQPTALLGLVPLPTCTTSSHTDSYDHHSPPGRMCFH